MVDLPCESAVLKRKMASVRPASNGDRVVGFDEYGFAVFEIGFAPEQPRVHAYRESCLSEEEVAQWQKTVDEWQPDNASHHAKMVNCLKKGVPRQQRSQLWKLLLDCETLAMYSKFSYKANLTAVREQLVDLGVSEYGGMEAVCTLSELESQWRFSLHTDAKKGEGHISLECLRQILLDLDRSYPTHEMFMGRTAKAKEGRASLFRVLAVYARYNRAVEYCQGMSSLAGMLLMQMSEVEAFWCMVSLLERKKYLLGYFDNSLGRIQRHAAIFHKLLQQRLPQLCQHLESVGLQPLMFVTPWYMCLFTGLPCWDTVLSIWDLLLLDGINTMFGVGLAIMTVMEKELLSLKDLTQLLPKLLHVPPEVAQYDVLMPAIWATKVNSWEITGLAAIVNEEFNNNKVQRKRGRDTEDGMVFTAGQERNKRRKPNPVESPTKKPSVFQRIANIFTPWWQREGTPGPTTRNQSAASRSQVKGTKIQPLSGARQKRQRVAQRPGVAKLAQNMASPCTTTTENSFSTMRTSVLKEDTPVRRSPRLVAQRALRDVNTPSQMRLVSGVAAVQHAFKTFHMCTPVRKSQQTPGPSPSLLSSPEVELKTLKETAVRHM